MESVPTPKQSRKPKHSDRKQSGSLWQYSGMAFEMLITIGIFCAGGYLLDKKMELRIPVATIVMTLVGLIMAFYRIYKQ